MKRLLPLVLAGAMMLTTGATASQCAHALKAGGAAWVGMLTYARAGGRGEDRETAGQADFEV